VRKINTHDTVEIRPVRRLMITASQKGTPPWRFVRGEAVKEAQDLTSIATRRKSFRTNGRRVCSLSQRGTIKGGRRSRATWVLTVSSLEHIRGETGKHFSELSTS
jgi:hypothetical protein